MCAILFYACNSTKNESITQLENDFQTIKTSQLELIENYDLCLSLFSEKSQSSDGYKRVFCEITANNSNQISELNLIKTKQLIDKGYKIKIDAKNHYRIFYQYATKEYIAGIIRYGLIFTDIVSVKDSVYSLNLSGIDTLKQMELKSYIVEINEYAE